MNRLSEFDLLRFRGRVVDGSQKLIFCLPNDISFLSYILPQTNVWSLISHPPASAFAISQSLHPEAAIARSHRTEIFETLQQGMKEGIEEYEAVQKAKADAAPPLTEVEAEVSSEVTPMEIDVPATSSIEVPVVQEIKLPSLWDTPSETPQPKRTQSSSLFGKSIQSSSSTVKAPAVRPGPVSRASGLFGMTLKTPQQSNQSVKENQNSDMKALQEEAMKKVLASFRVAVPANQVGDHVLLNDTQESS